MRPGIKVDRPRAAPYPRAIMLTLAIPFPEISPELVSFPLFGFDFAIRWYALAYIAGLLIGWKLVAMLLRRPALWPQDRAPMTPLQLEALVTWVLVGVILGGRLGYVLFYGDGLYREDPWAALRVWDGGMAFHGGLTGVAIAALIFGRLNRVPLASLADALALAAPVGLLLGRIANFINAELWGRPTDAPWGVIFPGFAAQDCPGPTGLVESGGELLCARHPSQLYESGLEGLVLGLALFWLATRRGWLKRPGMIAGLFFAGYGAARIFVEMFRQADAQFIAANPPWGYVVELGPVGLTMGQVLSLPMLLGGLAVVALAARRTKG